MKIARYLSNGADRVGVVEGDVVREIHWSLRDLLVLAATGGATENLPYTGHEATVDEVTFLPPAVGGGRVFCAGINYVEHQRESADVFVAEVPQEPILFLKDSSTLAGAGAVLHLPKEVSEQFDWEAELGVVIGAPVRNVSAEAALHAVAGFTVVNDITARDLQTKHVQWTLGKNSVAATPIGPWIVTKDELGAEPELEISLRVNEQVKQTGNTRDMIFNVARLISTISAVMPLMPGDVIATGTPSGVGFKRNPPEFLHDGDVVETRIEGIGALINPVHTGLISRAAAS
ncbi:fumarylacetoacetate hydrolase family protein [Nocardioides sp. YIM 152315]|uniref:fumarylacetoacetate hydrolase family protein n=1 Tax=Nocardioides sp. YIM 152315 TaxID=3031760 RepID=UPI0023D9FC88|nr:fumarylacetoacetate hydrolase family protein [Nocardioides sp. YIM 152315]MDF1605837.1 fumarylacetoacetate hydrolase family protein [Nocardioides sp. YIM 152315]